MTATEFESVSGTDRPAEEAAAVSPLQPEITLEDFDRVDLRVCKVLNCEDVPKARNFLKLTLDDGLGGRVIMSTIKHDYLPGELVGRKIIVVGNLAPHKFSGVRSEGMLLAGDTPGGGCKVILVDDAVPVGCRIH